MNKLQKFLANMIGVKTYSGEQLPFRGSDVYNGVQYPPGSHGLKAQEQVSWIYACVQKNANRIAAVNWHLMRNDKEMTLDRAWKVFEAGNQFMTTYDLINLTIQSLELLGEAHWLIYSNARGQPETLLPLNTSGMKLFFDERGIPSYWVYTVAQVQQRLEFEDVVYFRYPDPSNAWRGLSPLKAATRAADTDIDASLWNRNFFRNAAVPSGILSTEQPITDSQETRIKTWLRRFYGGVKNAHSVMLLENGMHFEPMQTTQRDMEFLALREFTRDEICAIYGVPPDLLGISGNSNRATAYIHEITYAKDTLTPKIKQIQGALNKYYLKKFEAGLKFTFDSVIPQDDLIQSTINTKYVAAGILLIDEVRETLGRDPLPEQKPEPEKTLKKKDLERTKELNEYQVKIRDVVKPYEKDIKGWVAARFTQQQKEMIRRLKRLILSDKSYSKEEEEEQRLPLISFTLAASYAAFMTEWILQGEEQSVWAEYFASKFPAPVRAAAEAFDDQFGIGINFMQFDENVEKMVMRRGQRFATRINSTTYDDLRVALIDKMLEKGLNEREMATTINGIMGMERRSRPETIARTELFSAINESHQLTLQDNGIKKKEWSAAFDERTREAHAIANGQITKTNEPFLVGGERLMYPGDPSGSAGNVINCRCQLIPFIE